MGIEIRNAAPEQFQAAIEVINSAFLETRDPAAVAADLQGIWDPARTWLAWDGDVACGTFRSWPTRLTVPGGSELAAAAVSAVTVRPDHRRRGVMTALAASEHAAIRERGEPIALLHASEYPIYGRLGYGPATRSVEYTIDTRRARYGGDPAGTVDLLQLGEAARDACRPVFDTVRRRRPGEIWRRPITWDIDFGLKGEAVGDRFKGFVAVHRDAAGEVDGYVRYSAKPTWDRAVPQGEVTVEELQAATEGAEDDLMRFVLSIDLVSVARLGGRRLEERFPWRVTDQRTVRVTDVVDGVWVRLVDVPRALEARTFERAGCLVLEVVDDPALGGTRRLALEAGPDGATCRPTDRSPDLTLPVAALGAAYLGGTRLRHATLVTGADEHREGALAEADALFRTTAEPWCSTFF